MQSALQNVQQVLQNAADSSVVVAIMTSRFTDAFKGAAAELSKALQGVHIVCSKLRHVLRVVRLRHIVMASMCAHIGWLNTKHYVVPGLMVDGTGLDEDAVGSIEHLQRRVSQTKFTGDPEEER